MTRISFLPMTIALLLTVFATANTFAAREVSIRRLDGSPAQELSFASESRYDCLGGNLFMPWYSITDFIHGDEVYAHVFGWWPDDWYCDCPLGFRVDLVYMFLEFGPEDVPASFDVMATANEAAGMSMPVYCPYPGGAYSSSDVYTVQIDTPGNYYIGIPMTSECAFMSYTYTLSFHFLTAFDPDKRPSLITDQFSGSWPQCRSYVSTGLPGEWEDLMGLGLPGNVILFAEQSCCEFPVPSEPATWGSLKALYR
jgi:hypothetical protein